MAGVRSRAREHGAKSLVACKNAGLHQTASVRRIIQAIALTIVMAFNFAVSAQDNRSPVQSDTLMQMDKALRQHRSGVAGQVMYLYEVSTNHTAFPEQATLGVYVKGQKGKLMLRKKLLTAADGTFYLELLPGDYVIQPIITPEWWIETYGLSWVPVPVKIERGQLTTIEVDVIQTSDGGSGVITTMF
jgi:hypothetical protein